MALLFFLVEVFIISFSGAMQPGPVTATALAIGARNRYAGLALAVGHAIIEFPMMILIVLGAGAIFKLPIFQIIVGAAGGTILLIMAIKMLIGLKAAQSQQQKVLKDKPIWAGVILSATNPYFLLWWATVGLALATTARGFGIWAFALFAVVHWLTDCLWLQALSWASFKGTKLMGEKVQKAITIICAAALAFFGLFFIYNAVAILSKTI